MSPPYFRQQLRRMHGNVMRYGSGAVLDGGSGEKGCLFEIRTDVTEQESNVAEGQSTVSHILCMWCCIILPCRNGGIF